MRVAMIGTGYVGLVSAACFSEFGVPVTCADTDDDKIKRLRAGEVPIYEPGLGALLRSNIDAGRLTFTTDSPGAVAQSDIVMIAVGTPTRRGDGHADLSGVSAPHHLTAGINEAEFYYVQSFRQHWVLSR